MNEFRLQLKLKDGQSLGYIQMRGGKPYYDYGYSEATLFDSVGVLNLLNRISLDKYDVYAEVPYTTNKGRRGTITLKNEELKTYIRNELGKVQVMENKNMNEKMIDKYGREVDPKEWEEKEAKGLNEDEQFAADPEGALADFLGSNPEDVVAMNYDHYGIPMFEADGEEWAVTDDYDLVEEAAQECLDVDGPGHLLSGYDGNMVEHDFEGTTFYMFRQN